MQSITQPSLPRLFPQPIKAGFPNPAEDATGNPLDLNQLVVKHPTATFYLRVEGDSMAGIGLKTGDVIAVDRSLEPRHGDVVVGVVNGEFTLKRLKKEGAKAWLVPENPDYEAIALHEAESAVIWGVVTYAISRLR